MSDDFSARYRLLKCVLVEDGIRTHNAQEVASGRVVMVHITDAAGPEEVDALRAQLAALGSADKNKVLEAVTLPSGFAVVTEFLSAPLTFRSWLAAHAVAEPTVTVVPGSSATIPMPDARVTAEFATQSAPQSKPQPEPQPEAQSAASVTPPPPASADGGADSFSAIFGNPASSAPSMVEYPQPSSSHVGVDLAGAVAPAAPAPAPAPAPAAPAVQPAAAKPEPGEFTRMFSPSADQGATIKPVAHNSAPNPVSPSLSPTSPPILPPPIFSAPPSPMTEPAASAPMASAPVVSAPVVSAPVVSPPVVSAPVVPPLPATPVPPSPLTAAASMGFAEDVPASAPTRKPPGEFTMMFGAPETAAPLPETVRPSPMREAPPPTFSPLTPERRLESPPVEPMHRVMSQNPQYVAGIQQDGPSPIAPNIVGGPLGGLPPGGPSQGGGYGGQYGAGYGAPFGGLPPLTPMAPPPPAPPAHASPLFAAAGPPSGAPSAGAPSAGAPGILPPPIFGSGTSTPLSALGGAAPLVNASAGPSEFTKLISSAADPVLPPLAPTAERTPGRASTSNSRRMPQGLIIVINAVLLIAALLMFFVLRRPLPTVQTVMPARPVLPTMPSAPQLPTTPPAR